MQFSAFIARRFLARQKGTFSAFIIRLAIIATALGVAVMIVATSMISGFKTSVREKLFSFWGHAIVTSYDRQSENIGAANPIEFSKTLEQQIAGYKHVRQVARFAMRPVIVQANGEMEGLRLKGIDQDFKFSKGISFIGKKLSFADTAYTPEIIISQTTADRMMLKLGDDLLLYAIEPGTTSPRIRKLKVTAIYHTGMEEVDKNFAIADLRLVQRLSNWATGQISGYQIEVDNPATADSVANGIYQEFVEPPMEARSIGKIYEGLFGWLNMQDVNATILILIVSIMAVINMGASLLILIIDRAVMVGVLKSLGMPDDKLRNIFLYLSGLIGIAGLIIGNVIGLGLCFAQMQFGFIHLPEDTYYMKTVPINIVWWQILVIDIGTLALCLVCMLLPTLYIRKIQPVKVLQFK